MGIVHTLRLLMNHPLNSGSRTAALARFARWQLGSRVLNQPALLPMGGGGFLLTRRGETGATGNYYYGLHEYPDMLFVAHLLRPGDLFLDVGANIGSYSVLAASATGANVIACEPVTSTFERARKNIGVNLLEHLVDIRRVAVGGSSGEVRMTRGLDTVNHIAAPGEPDTETCPIVTLDSLAEPGRARLVKIDVEGFELQVVKGGSRLLSEPTLLGLVIELNGSGARYGVRDDEIDAAIRNAGLEPCSYDPRSRDLKLGVPRNSEGNTLYVRRGSEAQERLRSAPKVKVLRQEV